MALKKTVMRIDAGTLRPPVRTEQGFLRADGLVARPGIYEYINTAEDEADGLGKKGALRRELRTREEVTRADVLAQYEGAPITIFHPKKMVDSKNVRALEVGSVTGPGRVDEAGRVGVSMMIKDAKAVQRIDSGELVELSPGYRCELLFSKGFAPEYATKTNPRGAYDFIQENIRVNHLALVDRARGGEDLRIRLDRADMGISCSVERGDCGCGCACDSPHSAVEEMVEKVLGIGQLVTDSVDGHQHALEGASGRTTYSVSAGQDVGHDHAFVRNADGSYLILDNAGHSHEVLTPGGATIDEVVEVVRVDEVIEYDAERLDHGDHDQKDHAGGGGGSSSPKGGDKGGGSKEKGGGDRTSKLGSDREAARAQDAKPQTADEVAKDYGGDKLRDGARAEESAAADQNIREFASKWADNRTEGVFRTGGMKAHSPVTSKAVKASNEAVKAGTAKAHEQAAKEHETAARVLKSQEANSNPREHAVAKLPERIAGHESVAASHRAEASRLSAKRGDAVDVGLGRLEPNISARASAQRLDGIGPQVRPVAAEERQGAKTMDHEEQIRSLKAQLAESEKLAAQRQSELTASVERGDRAEARVQTLETENRELETKLVAGAQALETEAIRTQAERADRAEAIVRDNEARFDDAVRSRTATIRRAMVVMGEDFNPDRMSNREIHAIVVKRLDAAADISSKVTDAYIAGRFDSLVELHNKTARSLSRAGTALTGATRGDRAEIKTSPDARTQRASDWRNQWKQGLPSARDNRNAKKEA